MKQIKFYGKQLLLFLLILLSSTLLLSLINYFDLLSPKITNILSNMITLITTLWIGYQSGLQTESKGYLEGMKLGGILILTLISLNTIFYGINFKLISWIYYIIIIGICTIGAMIGINKKKE